jgi:enamine deaminase RidA (YjgF/YER057c/UK114 family)
MSSPKIEIVNPPALAEPLGYSNGISAVGGKFLFIAGQIGWNREKRFVSDDFADQFALALENVVAVVREAGGEPSHLVRMLIFVTDKKEYLSQVKAIGVAYRQIMGKHYPAMSLVEVNGLVEDLAKVEIEAIAMIPEQVENPVIPESEKK